VLLRWTRFGRPVASVLGGTARRMEAPKRLSVRRTALRQTQRALDVKQRQSVAFIVRGRAHAARLPPAFVASGGDCQCAFVRFPPSRNLRNPQSGRPRLAGSPRSAASPCDHRAEQAGKCCRDDQHREYLGWKIHATLSRPRSPLWHKLSPVACVYASNLFSFVTLSETLQ
jgi:hypothetical protein